MKFCKFTHFAHLILVTGVGWYSSATHLHDDDDITTVHVVFMNHLDVGFDGIMPTPGLINNVLNRYFGRYFPMALNVVNEIKARGSNSSFIYTTHPFLVSLYVDCLPNLVLAGVKLQCPNATELAAFEDAIRNGYITWHAGAMNMQYEMMDEATLSFSLKLGADLDTKYGIVRNGRVMSNRDVPGVTRSVIPGLLDNGVVGITVGVNILSAPPDVPKIFRWVMTDGGVEKSVIGMWHPGGYPRSPGVDPKAPGGLSRQDCVTFPGLQDALCFAFKGDNQGPPLAVSIIDGYFSVLRSEFPGAKIMASTLESFVAAVQPVKSQLPVIRGEIGDVWIQGVASDPRKVAEMRGFMRARTSCLASGACSYQDNRFYNSSRIFSKATEHTWGICCAGDTTNWTNAQYSRVRDLPLFTIGEKSWDEQREIMYVAMDALQNHSLANQVREEWAELQPKWPDLTDYYQVPNNYVFKFPTLEMAFATDGSINHLVHLPSQVSWASNNNRMGQFIYQTFVQADFDRFQALFSYDGHNVGMEKPGIINVTDIQSRMWDTSLKALYMGQDNSSILVNIVMTDMDTTCGHYGAPMSVWVRYTVVTEQNVTALHVDFQWFQKVTTRLPEALYFGFTPVPSDNHKWQMDKLGYMVNPLDVLVNGSQRLHAIQRGVCYMDDTMSGLEIQSPDVAVVAMLIPTDPLTVFPTPLQPLTNISGVAFNLYNNVWNVNYIMWYPWKLEDTDFKARFVLRFQ